jgi:hypothetical protein
VPHTCHSDRAEAGTTVFAGRPAMLEITETEVRAREGWTRRPLGKKEVFRSALRSIHYLQTQISFRGRTGSR